MTATHLRLKRPLLSLLLIILVVLHGCETSPTLPKVERVILIVCDTLSARHMPSYGYEGTRMDVFDELASQGVLFKHCVAPQVWTLTSHMSIFTGLEPGVHRVDPDTPLARNIPMLAETLVGTGFQTGAFRTGNGWLDPQFGFDRGFGIYKTHQLTSPLAKSAREWAEENVKPHADQAPLPAFCFLHYMDTHTRPSDQAAPYTPMRHRRLPEHCGPTPAKVLQEAPEENDLAEKRFWDLTGYDVEYLRCSYDLCVDTWDDTRLSRLKEELKAPAFKDALVIITSDHGEEFLEHGKHMHHQPHAEVRDVPLLMIWPERLPAGVIVEDRVALIDLAPTILDLAGMDPPESCQGLSLRPLLEQRDGFPIRDFHIDGNHRGRPLEDSALVGRVDGTWYSLVVRTDRAGCRDSYRPERVEQVTGLFNLDEDPLETQNLMEQRSTVVEELRRRLEDRLEQNVRLAEMLGTGTGIEGVDLSEQEQERLRALGY